MLFNRPVCHWKDPPQLFCRIISAVSVLINDMTLIVLVLLQRRSHTFYIIRIIQNGSDKLLIQGRTSTLLLFRRQCDY